MVDSNNSTGIITRSKAKNAKKKFVADINEAPGITRKQTEIKKRPTSSEQGNEIQTEIEGSNVTN